MHSTDYPEKESPMPDPMPPELALDVVPFTDDTLDVFLHRTTDDVIPETSYPEIQRWTVTDDNSAEWAARKLAEAAEVLARVAEQASAWRARIDEWQKQQSMRSKKAAEFFDGHLRDYARRVRDASADEIKTVRLPSATVSTRGGADKVVVEDAEAFLTWAKYMLESEVVDVVAPRSTSLTGIRSFCTIDDEPVKYSLTCGCVVIEPEDGFETPEGALNPFAARGDGVRCPECRVEALVGDYAETQRRITFQVPGQGAWQKTVPGLAIEKPEVTASVKLTTFAAADDVLDAQAQIGGA